MKKKQPTRAQFMSRTGRTNLVSFRGGTTEIPVHPVRTYYDLSRIKKTK